MRRIGIGREHRAQGGWIQEHPFGVVFLVLMAILVYLAALRGQDSAFFRLGLIANTIYNVVIILAGITGFIHTRDWLARGRQPTSRDQMIALGVAFFIIFAFALFGEVIGRYVFGMITGT